MIFPFSWINKIHVDVLSTDEKLKKKLPNLRIPIREKE